MTATLWDEPGVVASVEKEWIKAPSIEHRRQLRDIITALDAPRTSVLDVGCGVGMIHDVLVPACCEESAYTGVDWSAAMLRRARERVPGARFVEGDLYALPWAAASVDLVVCCEVLGHVPNLASALAELQRVARYTLFFSLWIGTEPRPHTTMYQLPDVWSALGRQADQWWEMPNEIVAFEVRQ